MRADGDTGHAVLLLDFLRRGLVGILHRTGSHEEIQSYTGFGLRHLAIPRNQAGEEGPLRAIPESRI